MPFNNPLLLSQEVLITTELDWMKKPLQDAND